MPLILILKKTEGILLYKYLQGEHPKPLNEKMILPNSVNGEKNS